MTFEFHQQNIFTKQLDLVDIGDTAIYARGKGQYYLIVKTIMGKTSIFKFGPCLPDMPVLLDGFTFSYKQMDYSEQKICKEIRSMLNDTKAEITQAEQIDPLTVLSRFPDVMDCYNNL